MIRFRSPSEIRYTPWVSIGSEYDFTGGRRGKYARRSVEGTKLVLLDSDVAAMFPDAASVNRALRKIIRDRAGGRRGAR